MVASCKQVIFYFIPKKEQISVAFGSRHQIYNMKQLIIYNTNITHGGKLGDLNKYVLGVIDFKRMHGDFRK
jgi:hypothetical protein